MQGLTLIYVKGTALSITLKAEKFNITLTKTNQTIFFLSQKEEKWEKFENAAQNGTDRFYSWENSPSRDKLKGYKIPETKSEEEERYRDAVTAVKLEPEPLEKYKFDADRRKVVDDYKKSVLDLLGHKNLQVA